MNAFLRHCLALSLCAACSCSGATDEASTSPPATDTLSLAGAATELSGAAPETAAPSPITEEELLQLLDALEQEIGRRK